MMRNGQKCRSEASMAKKKSRDHQLEIILNSIADGVFTIDLKKNITSFNKAAERITGITAEHAVGQKCFDVFHSNICQGNCALEKTLRTGKENIDLPVNIIDSKGVTVPISVRSQPMGHQTLPPFFIPMVGESYFQPVSPPLLEKKVVRPFICIL